MLKLMIKLFIIFVNHNINYYFKDRNGGCCYYKNSRSNKFEYDELENLFWIRNYKIVIKKTNPNLAYLYNKQNLINSYYFKKIEHYYNSLFLFFFDELKIFDYYNDNKVYHLENVKKIIYISNLIYIINNQDLYNKDKLLTNNLGKFLISVNKYYIAVKNKNKTKIIFPNKDTIGHIYNIDINFKNLKKFNIRLYVVKNDNKFNLLKHHQFNSIILEKENIIYNELFLLNINIYVYKDKLYKYNHINKLYIEYQWPFNSWYKIKTINQLLIYYFYEFIFENEKEKLLLILNNKLFFFTKIFWKIDIIYESKYSLIIYLSDNYLKISKLYTFIPISSKIDFIRNEDFIKMYNIGLYLFVYFRKENNIFLKVYNLNKKYELTSYRSVEIQLKKIEEFNIYDNLIISENYFFFNFKFYLHNFRSNWNKNQFHSKINYNNYIDYFENYKKNLNKTKELKNLYNKYSHIINFIKNNINKIENFLIIVSEKKTDINVKLNKNNGNLYELNEKLDKINMDINLYKNYYRASVFILIIFWIAIIIFALLKFTLFKDIRLFN